MNQAPVQALPPAGRNEHVRIGPISVFALIVIICMAVLAVLTISTANASLVMSQRQAEATQELYLNEAAAQTFLAEIDSQLDSVRSSGGSGANAGAAGAQAVGSGLEAASEAARSAGLGQVEVEANIAGQQVDASFTCENGRTLKIVVTILSDGSYRIDKWKMTAVVNEEQPMGNLYTGA